MKKEAKEAAPKCYYRCMECGLLYHDSSLAAQCYSWCKKNHSCNTKILKYALHMKRRK